MATKAKPKSKLPGQDYLIEFDDRPRADKCACKSSNPMFPSGAWLVEHDGKLYAFSPSTQMQKDIWLGSAERSIGKEAGIAMLRWFCFGCQTVQAP